MWGGGVRCGSGQDLVFLLVVQLLLDQTLLILPVSLRSLLAPKLLLLPHLSLQVGFIRLTGLLLTAKTNRDQKQRPVQVQQRPVQKQKQVQDQQRPVQDPAVCILVDC